MNNSSGGLALEKEKKGDRYQCNILLAIIATRDYLLILCKSISAMKRT